jgi:hypothetical protein
MLPKMVDGVLPPGIHDATWAELAETFGQTPHRKTLLGGLRAAAIELRRSGCRTLYLDGSFVTAKEVPEDYDGCWSAEGVDPEELDLVLLTFDEGQATQKAKYLGELFPAETVEAGSGKTFRDFFQADQDGRPKGIVQLDLADIR